AVIAAVACSHIRNATASSGKQSRSAAYRRSDDGLPPDRCRHLRRLRRCLGDRPVSLQPPSPERSQVGDVWVDPITADRFIFTGENLDQINYGWVRWDLASEQAKYERDEVR